MPTQLLCVFSKCSQAYLCVPATAPSRNYVLGDPEVYCVGYPQVNILESKIIVF